jgi:hypothetical protein
MTRQRRLLLACVFAACAGTVLACSGAGSPTKSAEESAAAQAEVEAAQAEAEAAQARTALAQATTPAEKAAAEQNAAKKAEIARVKAEAASAARKKATETSANAAAEEARKKKEAEAEAKRKAEEEYDAQGLVLLRKTVKSVNGEITGTVVNRRDHKLAYAQIQFNVYDDSGAQVGTALANINGLEPGGRWNFTATSFGTNYRTYKFSELSGF